MTRPIASNDDEPGRQKNRRVEFHIKQDAKAADDDAEESDTSSPLDSLGDSDDAEEEKPAPKKNAEPDKTDFSDDPANW
jgi:hypothetical protein